MKKRKRRRRARLNTIDKILLGIVVFLLVFVIAMIWIYIKYQSEPTTLITCVFSLLGGEVTLSFAIWYIKKRYAAKYLKEDMKDGRLQGTDED